MIDCDLPRPVRLVAQDASLSRRRSGVRIPYGLSKTTHICWVVFCFYVVFPAGYETESPAEAGVRIPYGLSKTTHICWVVFCFLDDFVDSQKDSNAAGKSGSNPLWAIKNHSHLLRGFLLFVCFFSDSQQDSTGSWKEGFESPTGY